MNLSDLVGLGIKSIQQGVVDVSSATSGTGEEACYTDVTISAVDTSKALVLHDIMYGGDASSTATAQTLARYGAYNLSNGAFAHAYLTSSTNLRVYSGTNNTRDAFSGRWVVVEFY